MDKRRLFRCQGLTHIVSECPNKRVVSLAEYQASLEEPEEEKEGGHKELYLNCHFEEVEGGLNERELLVIRRALSRLAT